MDKMIIIRESDLKSLIQEAVTNAVDGITKKIASTCAVMSYNNEIFREHRRHRVISEPSGGCGCDDGGCGSSSSRSSGGGCGGGYSSGGC